MSRMNESSIVPFPLMRRITHTSVKLLDTHRVSSNHIDDDLITTTEKRHAAQIVESTSSHTQVGCQTPEGKVLVYIATDWLVSLWPKSVAVVTAALRLPPEPSPTV